MDTKLNRLQLIQNHAARIITCTKKFDHISGVLKNTPLVTNQGENRLKSITIGSVRNSPGKVTWLEGNLVAKVVDP